MIVYCVRTTAILVVASVCLVTSAPKGHMDYFGYSGTEHQVPEIWEMPSSEEFFKKYVFPNKAVVLKGASRVMPALTKWSDDYLSRNTPDSPDGDVIYEVHKDRTPSNEIRSINFRDFLKSYNGTFKYMSSLVMPWFRQDVVYPNVIQCPWFNDIILTSDILMSSGESVALPHTDDYENMFCQIRGVKKLVLVNTHSSPVLTEQIVKNRRIVVNLENTTRLNLTRYPEYEGLDFHHATIQPGDCLYLPLRWIHHVRSFGSNVAITMWFKPSFAPGITPEHFQDRKKLRLMQMIERPEVFNFNKCSSANNKTLVGASIMGPGDYGLYYTSIPVYLAKRITETLKGRDFDLSGFINAFLKTTKYSQELHELRAYLEEIFMVYDEDKDGIVTMTEISRNLPMGIRRSTGRTAQIWNRQIKKYQKADIIHPSQTLVDLDELWDSA